MRGFAWKTAVLLVVSTLFAACAAEAPPVETAGGDVLEERVAEIVEETAVVPPTPTQELILVNLEDLGPAPEIKNDTWLNTDKPLPLTSQRGKVVLLEFWTFG